MKCDKCGLDWNGLSGDTCPVCDKDKQLCIRLIMDLSQEVNLKNKWIERLLDILQQSFPRFDSKMIKIGDWVSSEELDASLKKESK